MVYDVTGELLGCHVWLKEFLRWTLVAQLVSKVAMMMYSVFKVV